MDKVIKALSNLRVDPVMDEFKLQEAVKKVLDEARIVYSKEYRLGPRNRVDFLTTNGIAIEVKKGKPYSEQVVKQLTRYSEFEKVTGIILVIEKSMRIPHEINGKKCMSFGLNKLWGIAL
jgi:hypothetical protein